MGTVSCHGSLRKEAHVKIGVIGAGNIIGTLNSGGIS
jgi:hypothetical protein